MSDGSDWRRDVVTTAAGTMIPVRATARRPTWADLPLPLRELVEQLAGARVQDAESAGTGFTPGFASRLDLADGRQVFVKAASSADDDKHGWPLSDAYREEVRKLTALPDGIGAPALLWHRDAEVGGLRWIATGYEYVDAVPPRRPWQTQQLGRVLDKLTEIAPALAAVPAGLALEPISAGFVDGCRERLAAVGTFHDVGFLETVEALCHKATENVAGDSIVHMDFRDDNVLIGPEDGVWIVDWNWPVMGAPWVDLVCLLLSARGDGVDVEELVARHPLSCDVDPASIDSLLAVLWTFWAGAVRQPVPQFSPHLRDHQAWYLAVTEGWLRERLAIW